jgi:S1-C subfamily serine protease
VTVAHVTLGGPASRAGLRKDDGIEAINGEPVKSSEDLMDMIYALKPGVKANLTLVRGGKQLTMNVVPDDGSKVRY